MMYTEALKNEYTVVRLVLKPNRTVEVELGSNEARNCLVQLKPKIIDKTIDEYHQTSACATLTPGDTVTRIGGNLLKH